MQIRTDRLVVRPLTPGMAEDLHRLSLDEDVRRFVPDEVFETEAQAAAVIGELIGCYGQPDAPQVYAVTSADGALLGYVQAAPLSGGAWEVGFHIGKAFTGQGLASEALTAFLPRIMAELGLRSIAGVCLADNLASRRVLEKCGFLPVFAGMGDYQGARQPICRYVYER